MKKLVQKMWVIKFLGNPEWPKKHFKLESFAITKEDCQLKKKRDYPYPDFRVVKVKITEE